MSNHSTPALSVRSVSATATPSSSARVAFLVVVTAAFAAMFLPLRWRWLLAIPILLGEVHLLSTAGELWRRSVFWPLFFAGFAIGLPWPLTFVAPLVGYGLLCAAWPRARPPRGWLVRGRLSGAALAWMIPTILVSSGALLGWVLSMRPDLSDLVPLVPRGGVVGLVAVGLAFSVLNALWEELILKAILWHGLEAVFARPWVVNVVQALLFGVIH